MKTTAVICPNCKAEIEVSKDDVKRIRAALNGMLGRAARAKTLRHCPNPKCGRFVALWATVCKRCGQDISH